MADDQFARIMANLLPRPFAQDNKVTPLRNGDQIFPSMLHAIRSAQRTIAFETFIYWAGKIGQEFADAVAERSRVGIKVHALLDWFGSKEIDPQALQRMEDVGVEVERYHKIHFVRLRSVNHRTHRKLLIIDGSIGFTGRIADQWTDDG
ncbi:MAG: phospholipase D-like domain-containing protein [Pseudomonadota bacterium]|nr:phospholipase D-like domain-containing protein [Pseudomonadota bacterium]